MTLLGALLGSGGRGRMPPVPAGGGGGEYITTVESQTSWNGDPSDATAVTAAFDEAITEANANAGSSSTGRGVIELVQGTTYVVEASNGSGSTTNIVPAITLDLANVEVRTNGKPSIASGNQAILKFADWAGQTGVKLRSIIGINANNVWVGWVELHGNKLSAGADLAARENWLLTVANGGLGGIDYDDGGNGGLMNLVLYDSSAVRLFEVYSHDALVDGVFVRGFSITDFRAEDCDFDLNRRQGYSHINAGVSGSTWDQIVWRRCKFRRTGDQANMPGERPGANVDIEPAQTNEHSYGMTFDDCDFDDSNGATFEKGEDKGTPSSGRGFVTDGKGNHNYLKMLTCRSTNNLGEAYKFNLRAGADIDNMELTDLVASTNGSNRIDFVDSEGDNDSLITNATITDPNVTEVRFEGLTATGNDVDITSNAHGATITTNGIQTITTP